MCSPTSGGGKTAAYCADNTPTNPLAAAPDGCTCTTKVVCAPCTKENNGRVEVSEFKELRYDNIGTYNGRVVSLIVVNVSLYLPNKGKCGKGSRQNGVKAAEREVPRTRAARARESSSIPSPPSLSAALESSHSILCTAVSLYGRSGRQLLWSHEQFPPLCLLIPALLSDPRACWHGWRSQSS